MIKLDSLTLDTYKDEYKSLKDELEKGKSKSNFICDISKRLEMSNKNDNFFGKGYVVLDDLNPVGYVYLSGIINDDVYMEYAILYDKRNQGYASRLVQELSDYLFLNYNIKNIKLDISVSNQSSIRVANKNGFEIDEDDFENRGYSNKIIFIKDNLFYENKRRIKCNIIVK